MGETKRCTRCKKLLPLSGFSWLPMRAVSRKRGPRHQSWCRVCCRVTTAARQRGEDFKAARRARERTPEGKAKKAAYDRAYHALPAVRARRRKREDSPRYRFMAARRRARQRLKRAADPKLRARIARLVALYDAELARLRGRNAGVRK